MSVTQKLTVMGTELTAEIFGSSTLTVEIDELSCSR